MADAKKGQVIPPGEDEQRFDEAVSVSTLSAIEEGDRRSMIAAAKENPRSLTLFRKELDELVTISETVAAEMTYSLPRGDGQKIGPSIRFAEAVVYCYRNLRAGREVIDIGDAQLTAEGRVYDAERNNGIAVRINRNITGRKGRFNQDMIGVTGAAASSIAYRNAVLAYVPKALWIDSWEKSKLAVVGKAETIGKKRTDALAHFNAMGVTDIMVFNTLNVRGVEDLQTDELVTLKTWAREIKAGTRTIEDVFGSPLDVEIERIMKDLDWNETQKRLSRGNFAGNREKHLAFLKEKAAAAGIAVEEPATKPAATKPAETVREQPKEEDTKSSEATEEAAPATPAKNTDAKTTTSPSGPTSTSGKPATKHDW